MKNIALLHFAYPPNFGGVEIVISQQAQVLADLGYPVTVLVGAGEEHDPRIQLHAIPEFQSLMQFSPTIWEKTMNGMFDPEYTALVTKIRSLLEEYGKDQDVLLVHNMMTIYRNLAFVEAFAQYVKDHPEKKCIIWVHDHIFLVEGEHLEERKDNAHLVALLTTPIPGATYVVISETFATRLEEVLPIPKEQVHVIPDGISIKELLEIDTHLWDALKKQKLVDAFPLVLVPVNILPRKNLEYTIEVFASLKKLYPKAAMLISGAPSVHRNTKDYLEKIRSTITSLGLEKDVIFLQDIVKNNGSDTMIHDLYLLSDVVLYFSKSENFGLPLIEAALYKTPIFISNLRVFHEIGNDYLSFIDTESVKPADAAITIQQFFEGNKLASFRKDAKQKYSLEHIIKDKLVPLF